MEAYPSEYVSHNLPLIVLSGLEAPEEPALAAPSVSLLEDGGRTITSDQPLVGGETAQHLLREFGNADGTKAAWNNRPGRLKGDLIGFKFRAVGRVGQASSGACVDIHTHATIVVHSAAPKGQPSYAAVAYILSI